MSDSIQPDNLPTPTPGKSRSAIRIVLLTVALLVGWRALLTQMRPADFAENSYQQNLLRIETLQRRLRSGAPPSAVLAGTSITGRLLTDYFEGTTLSGIANLGLDGTSPAFSLEILLRQAQLPRRIFLETYLLHKGAATNEDLIRTSLDSVVSTWTELDPFFHTEMRPTTLLYAALKRNRESAALGRPAANRSPYPEFAPAPGTVERISRAIEHLRTRGSEVILIDLAVGKDWPPGPNMGEPVASQLVAALKLRRLDCRVALQSGGFEPRFTDGVHLDSPSAREVAKVLAKLADPP